MKRLQLYIVIISLIASMMPLLNAQDQSRFNQAVATLQEYGAKFPRAINKVINCARGVESCTQSEITQARTILGVIGAALTVVALGVTIGGVTAKAKGWWPFQQTDEPMGLSPSHGLTGENPLYATGSKPLPELPIQQKKKKALDALLQAIRDTQTPIQNVQSAVNSIREVIRDGQATLGEQVPGQRYNIASLLSQIVILYNVK